jgi:hypothetical protein
MTLRIGRIIATVVAIVVGLFVLVDLLISQWHGEVFRIPGFKDLDPKLIFNGIGFFLVSWATIVVAFALLLGFVNVITVHLNRIRARQRDSVYSAVLVVSLLATLLFGMSGPASDNGQFIFKFILQPLESTFFALLAIFIATAAFRAFRINISDPWALFETFFFVILAVIVLLGQVPVSIYIWSELPVIKEWILNVPVLAGVRGILLGVALGAIATGLRVLIGADRPYTD